MNYDVKELKDIIQMNQATLKEYLDLFSFVNYLLCILWTNDKTLTTQNTFVSDNMCLIAGKADCLDRTMADTLITIFTI